MSFFDFGRLVVYRDDGATVEVVLADTTLFNPNGVAVDSLGHVWFADRDTDIGAPGEFRGALFRWRHDGSGPGARAVARDPHR